MELKGNGLSFYHSRFSVSRSTTPRAPFLGCALYLGSVWIARSILDHLALHFWSARAILLAHRKVRVFLSQPFLSVSLYCFSQQHSTLSVVDHFYCSLCMLKKVPTIQRCCSSPRLFYADECVLPSGNEDFLSPVPLRILFWPLSWG